MKQAEILYFAFLDDVVEEFATGIFNNHDDVGRSRDNLISVVICKQIVALQRVRSITI